MNGSEMEKKLITPSSNNPQMRYRISYYEQSFSKLFVRNCAKNADGLFHTFVFYGVSRISIPTFLELNSHGIEVNSLGTTQPLFSYMFDSNLHCEVVATQIKTGFAKDFPDVKKIAVIKWVS